MSSDVQALVLTIRFIEGRYHGEPDWPPAPARLFQALIAAAATGDRIDNSDAAALRWLEEAPPPSIAAPHVRIGQAVKLWVPNNDIDAKGGDPAAVATIRTGKMVRPRLFDETVPLLYVWELMTTEDRAHATRLCELALKFYQLGRGVDMAWATGALVPSGESAALLLAHPGNVYRPTSGGMQERLVLSCPQQGSFSSLETRYAQSLHRFQVEGRGRKAIEIFQQPPKPLFAQVPYNSPPAQALFELHPVAELAAFSSTPLAKAAPLTEALRDAAADRLSAALPDKAHHIERALIGRRVEGMQSIPPVSRVRILPLPSIGHVHADQGIRRVLIDVPAGNPLRADDVFWAFSGLSVRTPLGVETVVTPAGDSGMLAHYGIATNAGARQWQTVTAAALPVARRRIDPARRNEEAKTALERCEEETRAADAVVQAVRHAGIRVPILRISVRREPFTAKGIRAEAFAPATRFEKERLWHVDITFQEPVSGPIAVGDGRFLGLGILAPVKCAPGVFVFRVNSGLTGVPQPDLASALRRAVLARFQAVIGEGSRLPAFVSGHRADGMPADDTPHLSFAHDPESERLLVLAPHAVGHRSARSRERQLLETLSQALKDFSELRAGRNGCLKIEATELAPDDDPLFAPSEHWVSRTPYQVNRHANLQDAKSALAADLEASCAAVGLPPPRVRVIDVWGEPGVGLTGRAELHFEVAVPGPLLLGRSRHKGGGLFGHPLRAGHG